VTIGVLPAVVPLSRILRQADEWTEDVDTPVPLAVDAETLRIVTVALSEGPHFLLAGTRGGGVTTLLRTWLVALAESFSADRVRLLLTGEDLQPLAGLPHAIPAFDRDTLGDAFDVAEETASRERAVVVAIGDAAEFMRVANTPTAEQLERLARATPAGLHFLIASSVQDVQALRMEAIGRVIRTCDTGFVLGSRNPSHLDVLNVSVPFGARGQTYELPPGLGYYARRGAARRVRVATAAGGADSLDGWLERIRRKAEFARVSARGTAENPASAS
jgi:hypothetical protein